MPAIRNKKRYTSSARSVPYTGVIRGKHSFTSAAARAQTAVAAARDSLMKGVERIGGFYGRFSGPSGENKFFDTALSFLCDSTGEVPATGQLTLIPQGVTESTRVGRKCTLKSIQLRLFANFDPGAGSVASTNIYIYVVQDTQCNGAAAAITDVLTSNVMGSALINLANSQRFVIHKRLVCTLQSGAGVTGAYGNAAKTIDYFKKVNIPIEFSSTTGAITEIRSNNLFLLAGASVGDDVTTITGNCRLRFSDN